MNLLRDLNLYIPFNDQELADKAIFVKQLKEPDIYSRKNLAYHVVTTAMILNKQRTKVLMIEHIIQNTWALPGGHADENENLIEVVSREITEETGIKQFNQILDDIFAIQIMQTPGHYRNNEYVSSHNHLDVMYLFEADENQTLEIEENKNTGVEWVELDKMTEKATEIFIKTIVYPKLLRKLKHLHIV